MNFAFRQLKQNWDCIWPDYQQNLSNKFDKVQQLEEQVGINIITSIAFLLVFAISTLLFTQKQINTGNTYTDIYTVC